MTSIIKIGINSHFRIIKYIEVVYQIFYEITSVKSPEQGELL